MPEKIQLMSQITLESVSQEDIDLLLSFAKRLKVRVVAVKTNGVIKILENRKSDMKKAALDPLFLSDIAEVTNDFKIIDGEQW